MHEHIRKVVSAFTVCRHTTFLSFCFRVLMTGMRACLLAFRRRRFGHGMISSRFLFF